MGGMGLNITGTPEADALLDRDPFSLVVAMLLDHGYPAASSNRSGGLKACRIATSQSDQTLPPKRDQEESSQPVPLGGNGLAEPCETVTS
jgi:hypothetical protein